MKRKILLSPLIIIVLIIILGVGMAGAAVLLGGGGGLSTSINLQKGLVGHWKMDGNAKDATPKSNDGTVSGASLIIDRKGQTDKAYSFDGTSSVITVSNFGTQIPSSEITISVWVKPIVGTGNDDLLTLNPFEPGGGSNRMNIHFPWDSTIHWQFGKTYQGVTVALDASWVGVWGHYVFTSSIAGNFTRIYRNGAQVATGGFTNPYDPTTQATLRIGGRSGNPFQGDMDDLRIYSRALSTTEITALYQQYDPGIQVSDLQKGLVGQWKMDGNAKDSTPNSNHGTLAGATGANNLPQLTNDRKGQALKAYDFDGTDDLVNLGSSSTLLPVNTLTLEAWVKPGVLGTNATVFSKGINSPWYGWTITKNGNNKWAGKITVGGVVYNAISDSTYTQNQWVHLAVTYDNATLKLYVDGVLQGTTASVTGDIAYTGTKNPVIGTWSPADTTEIFSGQIDEVRIYNRALSAAEVLASYESYNPGVVVSDLQKGLVGQWSLDGDAKDRTPYGNHGTLTGNAAVTATDRKGQTNKAVTLDGDGDYVSVGNGASISDLTKFTYAAWIYHDTNPAAATYQYLFNKNGKKMLLFYGNSGKPTAVILGDGNPTNPWVVSATAVTLSQWTHLVMTYDADAVTRARIYMDGQEVSYGSRDTESGTPDADNGGALFIGARSTVGDRNFDGLVDDARVYNRALSADEVTALYQSY